ncbi:flagellin N-terminal helical domain-containing protein [Limnoglobus roseus]|uniref:Flagellin n=1 Tax=Limnoglobus roseus TaxID=2598579 RepID=A0A5C1A6E0_9BACT|nr:flagellin [Limnoglobus roseus]QEL13787.1 flagellin [Limnoglobus roseus]
MALSINNNVASLNAQNSLNRTSNALSSSLQKLSTGLKVNKGADGPAALVISEQQRAQIAGLKTAIDNTNKAVALVQTGEGALNEVNSLLTKVRSLAVDSANSGVNDSTAQAANQAEIKNILSTVDRITGTTKFGSKNLFDGSAGVSGTSSAAATTFLKATTDTAAGSYAVTVTTAGSKGAVTAGTAQAANLAADENISINGTQIKLTKGSSQQQVVDKINEYSSQTGVTADISSGKTRLATNSYGADSSVTVVSDTAAAANSSGIGTTVATGTGVDIAGTINGNAYTGKGNVLTANAGVEKGLSVAIGATAAGAIATDTTGLGSVTVANNSLSFQVGANSGESVKVSFDKVSSTNLGVGASGTFGSLSQIDTSNGAEALKVIDKAISDVSELRSRLGAFQSNTLQSTANNLQTTLENTTAAESVVRDTDFASEIANYTKLQTQVQAGSTVLGNANQQTSLIANLLRG